MITFKQHILEIKSYEGLSTLLSPIGKYVNVGEERKMWKKGKIHTYQSMIGPMPSGSFRFVYIEKGKIVSALQIMSRDMKTGNVANAFTTKEFRGKGIASKLVTFAKTKLKNITFGTDRSDDGERFVQRNS